MNNSQLPDPCRQSSEYMLLHFLIIQSQIGGNELQEMIQGKNVSGVDSAWLQVALPRKGLPNQCECHRPARTSSACKWDPL